VTYIIKDQDLDRYVVHHRHRVDGQDILARRQ
jgi:hypothetical protein